MVVYNIMHFDFPLCGIVRVTKTEQINQSPRVNRSGLSLCPIPAAHVARYRAFIASLVLSLPCIVSGLVWPLWFVVCGVGCGSLWFVVVRCEI